MAGLFGLFGGNKNKSPQSKEAFFLPPDDAKTFGDIDYMRKEVVIRRTFAKKKGETEEMESVRSISSSTLKNVGEVAQPQIPSVSVPTPAPFGSPTSAPAPAAAAPVAPEAPASSVPTPAAAEAPVAAAAPAEQAPAPATPAPVAEAPQEPAVRRTPDTSMDMFRNMAKNMRR